jgi:hypothetical protein
MGRAQRKKKTLSQSEQQSASTSAPSYPAEDLLAKAHSLVDSLDYELARKFISRALEGDPENSAALELLGEVECELGDPDSGRQVQFCLLSSCRVRASHVLLVSASSKQFLPNQLIPLISISHNSPILPKSHCSIFLPLSKS